MTIAGIPETLYGFAGTNRFPRELSRLTAIRTMSRKFSIRERDLRLLDVGCGEGFISPKLSKEGRIGFVTGVDTHLSEQQTGLTVWA